MGIWFLFPDFYGYRENGLGHEKKNHLINQHETIHNTMPAPFQVSMAGRALPPGWEKVLDSGSGQYYFYNARQGVTQWDPPDTGARSATATFTTVTTTRKPKAGYKPRPVVNHNASFRQPVAYAHRSPRVVRQTTSRITTRQRHRGTGGGGEVATHHAAVNVRASGARAETGFLQVHFSV